MKASKTVYYRQLPDGTFVPCKPRRSPPDMGQRERYDHLAAQVRGRLVSRLDDLCAKSLLPELELIGIEWSQWIEILQRVQLALFPEEFAEVPPKGWTDGGLVPPGGISSVSEEQFTAFAASILANRTNSTPSTRSR